MKNPYIIPAAMICAAILAGFWILKSPSEPQKVVIVQPPQPPDISISDAARKGNIEAVKQHIAAGTNLNAKRATRTPLHWAAGKGHKEIAELLIAEGADVNAKDEDGSTTLDYAKGETADLLRKHGGKTKKELEAGN